MSHPPFFLRLATPADAVALQTLAERANRRYLGLGLFSQGRERPEPPDLEAIASAAAAGRALIAEGSGAALLGFAFWRIERPECFLEQISVDPDAGGRGVGSALLADIAQRAADQGLIGLCAYTLRTPMTLGFYKRAGFGQAPPETLFAWQLRLLESQAGLNDPSSQIFMRRCFRTAALPP